MKVEISAEGITSENFEQSKQPIKKAIKDTVPNVTEEMIVLTLKSSSSRRVLAASVIEAEIQTSSEEDSSFIASSITGENLADAHITVMTFLRFE